MLSKLERRLGRRLRPIGRPKKRETAAKGKAKAIGRMNFRYAQYVNRLHGRSGHLWQNRFFSCALDEVHCWRAMAYVERNPVRTRLVERAEDWAWSSLRWPGIRGRKNAPEFLSDGPVERGRHWPQAGNRPMTEAEMPAIRTSVNRGTPWGNPDWQKRTARRLGLESSLRPIGRPRLEQEK